MLTKNFIDYALKELESYKGKLFPNKLKLTKEMRASLENLYEHIHQFLTDTESTIQDIKTRDLISYIKMLKPYIQCKDVEKIYNLYQNALKSRDPEEIRNNQSTTPPIYNLQYVDNYIETVKKFFPNK